MKLTENNNYILDIPVAFIIFNRPKLTELVFNSIAKVKPKKLLIVADGSRFPEELEKCNQARSVIEKVNWKCEVLTNFSEMNLGCKKRVSSGLEWVFSKVEEAIILEDDCLPSVSFFYFCEKLLEYYRDDQRIMHISGSNFHLSPNNTHYSYYFSKYPNIWGWASWRRAWKYYDINMTTWCKLKQSNLFKFIFEDYAEQKYWTYIFDLMYSGRIDTWDYPWYYACLTGNGLAITPNKNLISNIGFGKNATHTFLPTPYAELPIYELTEEIRHPPYIIPNKDADNYTFNHYFGGKKMKLFPKNIYNMLQKMWR